MPAPMLYGSSCLSHVATTVAFLGMHGDSKATAIVAV